MNATAVETALIVRVEQIVEGEATCYCGAPAVLFVLTEPDDEPGHACYQHAMEWTDMAVNAARHLFGPKGE